MPDETLARRLADRLKALRQAQGWSLDRLAAASGVSRATLSRLEAAAVSPTTDVLGQLCSAYGLTLTRLLAPVEEEFPPLVRRAAQPVWQDPDAGFERRAVSPPSRALAAELLQCRLAPGARLAYRAPAVPGQEHHLLLLDGALEVTLDKTRHRLDAGDCLRYRLFGPSEFRTGPDQAAHYVLALI